MMLLRVGGTADGDGVKSKQYKSRSDFVGFWYNGSDGMDFRMVCQKVVENEEKKKEIRDEN